MHRSEQPEQRPMVLADPSANTRHVHGHTGDQTRWRLAANGVRACAVSGSTVASPMPVPRRQPPGTGACRGLRTARRTPMEPSQPLTTVGSGSAWGAAYDGGATGGVAALRSAGPSQVRGVGDRRDLRYRPPQQRQCVIARGSTWGTCLAAQLQKMAFDLVLYLTRSAPGVGLEPTT